MTEFEKEFELIAVKISDLLDFEMSDAFREHHRTPLTWKKWERLDGKRDLCHLVMTIHGLIAIEISGKLRGK